MYRRILAAVNEHVNSEIAGRYALHLAKAAKAQLFLCSIHEQGRTKNACELAREAARRLAHRAHEMDVEAACLFETGDPVRKIREVALARGIDIVFAATRREDVKKRLFAGTIARKLVLRLPCSVALVRVVHLGRIHPKEILIPLKARIDRIQEHAYFASLFAEAFDSRLYVFHITKPLRKFFHGERHLTPLEWETKLPDDIREFVRHLDRHPVAHERRLTPGTPSVRISIEAAARRSDLIIMGASTRTLFASLLRGSPVERVLRETPCDLIILRPGREEKA